MCRSTTFCQIPYTSLDLQKWHVLLCSHSMQSLVHTWKSFFVNKYLNFTSRAEVLHPSSFTKRDSQKIQDRIKERILKLVFLILWNQGLSVTLTTRETWNLSITIYKVNVYPVCACHHGKARGRIFCRTKGKAGPHTSSSYSDTNQDLASSRQFASVGSARQYGDNPQLW